MIASDDNTDNIRHRSNDNDDNADNNRPISNGNDDTVMIIELVELSYQQKYSSSNEFNERIHNSYSSDIVDGILLLVQV